MMVISDCWEGYGFDLHFLIISSVEQHLSYKKAYWLSVFLFRKMSIQKSFCPFLNFLYWSWMSLIYFDIDLPHLQMFYSHIYWVDFSFLSVIFCNLALSFYIFPDAICLFLFLFFFSLRDRHQKILLYSYVKV